MVMAAAFQDFGQGELLILTVHQDQEHPTPTCAANAKDFERPGWP